MRYKTFAAFCVAFFLLVVAPFNTARAGDFRHWEPEDWETVTADEIRAIIAAGADVNKKSKYGTAPLHRAANFANDPAIITALIEAGADVNGKAFGLTPLHLANNLAVIAVLIDAGADVQAKNSNGWTPLSYAARNNANPAAITTLIDAGADVTTKDDRGWTPLHWAASLNANPAVVTTLIESGADVNALDRGGCPPLGRAKSENTKALEHFGAKPLSLFTKCPTSSAWRFQ